MYNEEDEDGGRKKKKRSPSDEVDENGNIDVMK